MARPDQAAWASSVTVSTLAHAHSVPLRSFSHSPLPVPVLCWPLHSWFDHAGWIGQLPRHTIDARGRAPYVSHDPLRNAGRSAGLTFWIRGRGSASWHMRQIECSSQRPRGNCVDRLLGHSRSRPVARLRNT
jgi:hypothetical protein